METWNTGPQGSQKLYEDNKPPHPKGSLPLVCMLNMLNDFSYYPVYSTVYIMDFVEHVRQIYTLYVYI